MVDKLIQLIRNIKINGDNYAENLRELNYKEDEINTLIQRNKELVSINESLADGIFKLAKENETMKTNLMKPDCVYCKL